MRSSALVVADEFGPEMRKLKVQEQVFVCMLFSGLPSVTKAAEKAGYKAKDRGALRVQAHRLLHRGDIGRAVVEESKRRTQFLMPKAQKALDVLLDHPEHADHFKAVKLVREEVNGPVAVRRIVDMNVKVDMTDNAKIERIREFAKNHGIDPSKFLGFDETKIIDVTPEAPKPDEDELRELGIL